MYSIYNCQVTKAGVEKGYLVPTIIILFTQVIIMYFFFIQENK